MSTTITINQAIEKSMFLLGAGFSYGTGCLTSIQMFDNLREKILDNEDTYFDATEKETLKFLISSLSYHSEWRTMEVSGEMDFSPNIEELALLIRRIKSREHIVPYPITGNWADKLVQLEAQFVSSDNDRQNNLFESLNLKLKLLLKDEWLQEKNEKLGYLEPILNLLKSTADSATSFDIYTLNNDLVIEKYFSEHQQIPFRGFQQGEWRGLDRELNEAEFGRINLFKLHGSIDWIRLNDFSIWEKDKVKQIKFEGDDEKYIEEVESLQNNFDILDPYVIFGQGTKTFSVEPFFSLINHFNASLKGNDKEYIFVIGYSFFDPYINNLLFDAEKLGKRLIIINPNLGPTKLFQNFKVGEQSFYQPKWSGKDDFFEVEFTENCYLSDFVKYFKDIQKNSFYSELPEFNNHNITGVNTKYIPLTTAKFIEEFFKDEGSLFLKLIQEFEREKKEDLPFKDE